MPLNMRDNEGNPYNANRDLRYCYSQSLQAVVKRFEASVWPELNLLCEKNGVGWDELCDAMTDLSKFMAAPVVDPSFTMEQGLRKSGFLTHAPMTQVAIMAMLGQFALGQLVYAIRETTPLCEVPPDMLEFAALVQQKLSKRQRFRKLRRWLHLRWFQNAIPDPVEEGVASNQE